MRRMRDRRHALRVCIGLICATWLAACNVSVRIDPGGQNDTPNIAPPPGTSARATAVTTTVAPTNQLAPSALAATATPTDVPLE